MTKSERSIDTLSTELHPNWGWLLGLGILFVILGFIGLGMTVGLTLVSMFFLGCLFIIAGIAQLIDACKSHQWKGILGHALIAILYLIGGCLIVYDPILASVVMTALLAWMFIMMGVTRLLMAIVLRHNKGWGWLLFGGLTSIILGILILIQWPASGLWIIGLFIALELLVNGWMSIFMALGMKRA
jgi:uncharacterized membrane protein HdeD (DUF308 family)